jgi:NCS1 family nucleobase:cation symporter-1
LAYIIAIAPNFYGFLFQMGVDAPLGIQRFYYIAYPTGLIIGFVVYYVSCLAFAPPGMKQASGWMEPKEFVEDNDVSGIDGFSIDVIEPGFAEKGAVAVTRAANGEKGSF